MNLKLKPCPWCGRPMRFEYRKGDYANYLEIVCPKDKAMMMRHIFVEKEEEDLLQEKEELAYAWNEHRWPEMSRWQK